MVSYLLDQSLKCLEPDFNWLCKELFSRFLVLNFALV